MSVVRLTSVLSGDTNYVIKVGQTLTLLDIETGMDLTLATCTVKLKLYRQGSTQSIAVDSVAGSTFTVTIPDSSIAEPGRYRIELEAVFPGSVTYISQTGEFVVLDRLE